MRLRVKIKDNADELFLRESYRNFRVNDLSKLPSTYQHYYVVLQKLSGQIVEVPREWQYRLRDKHSRVTVRFKGMLIDVPVEYVEEVVT